MTLTFGADERPGVLVSWPLSRTTLLVAFREVFAMPADEELRLQLEAPNGLLVEVKSSQNLQQQLARYGLCGPRGEHLQGVSDQICFTAV